MIKKLYSVRQEHLDIVQQVQKENHLASESQAVRHIIESHVSMREQVLALCNRTEKMMLKLDWIEEKIDVLYDAVNTILVDREIEVCKPADLLESGVFKMSREYKKGKIADQKQRKDYRNKS